MFVEIIHAFCIADDDHAHVKTHKLTPNWTKGNSLSLCCKLQQGSLKTPISKINQNINL